MEMTEKMNELILKEKGRKIKVRPEVIVMVQYQNIQQDLLSILIQ